MTNPAPTHPAERRLAVIDMGSNTFRLVVFRFVPGVTFQLTEEIREPVRLSSGQLDGMLAADALERAERASALYAAYCEASGIAEVDAVATSAVRDAPNRADATGKLSASGRLPVRTLSAEEEAFYGYLGAINSTTLRDGTVLDLGGGSLQLGRVDERLLTRSASWTLGAVRMTERFLPSPVPSSAERRALRRHVLQTLGALDWLAERSGRLVAMGGSVRTLAIMAQRAIGYPLDELHGYRLTRDALGEQIELMAALPARQRQRLPGLKADRADITLAGAIVLDTVLAGLGLARLEVCGQGLRWGVFYERFLPTGQPLFSDVRETSVRNLASIYRYDREHAEHVAELALQVFDGTAAIGLHDGDRRERGWLWAAGILHDIGVIVDYNDHHRHGEYLVLNAGLPGFRHRELAFVALLVRGHRKSLPTLNGFRAIMEPGDDARYLRLASCLRLAEQLDRGRGRRIRAVEVAERAGAVTLTLRSEGDPSIARWAADTESEVFARAFGRELAVTPRRS